MKRLMVALLVGGMLFGAAWGAAAALNVDANFLQAGSDEVLICDADGVQVTYQDGWAGSPVNDFTITAVVVSGVNGACDGLLLEVVLTAQNGNWLASGAVTLPTSVVPMGTPPLASAVYDVHVIIR